MGKTKIEWVTNPDGTRGKTWNPVTGCTKVSPGCKNCYAERMARRLAGRYGYPEAPGHFNVTLHHDRLEQPLRWKKPRMIFVCSMGDLFHEDIPFRFMDRVFHSIELCQQHTFQILTKHPKRMLEYMISRSADFPLLNTWLGVSVENQATADERREYLRQTPAVVKFVSYEPALAPVDWSGWEFVDQIISGGESGPGARPSHPDWHRDTRDFCQENDIAYFMKQWGAWFPRSQWEDNPDLILPDDYHCMEGRNLKIIDDDIIHRVGKKAAGRLLDGRLWEEYPDE